MRLIASCRNCQKPIHIKEYVSDRCELARLKEKDFSMTCNKCEIEKTYSVDNVSAKPGSVNLVALILLFPCMAACFWLAYPYAMRGAMSMFILLLALLVPILIYITIIASENRKVRIFNSSRG